MSPMRERQRDIPPHLPALVVELPDGSVLRFSQTFHIGRDAECEVHIQDVQVSRRHAVVSPGRTQWTFSDLQSSNGSWVGDDRVESASIGDGITVRLGAEGPSVRMHPDVPVSAPPPPQPEEAASEESLDEYARRYFDSSSDTGQVGGRTMMIRRAFQQVQKKQKRRHRWVIAGVLVIGLAASAYAYYAHRQLRQLQEDAQKVFYDMKAVDVIIAGIQQEMARSGNTGPQLQVKQYLEHRREMESNYDKYVANLYDRRLNEKDRLILQVTRMFGECELAAPPEYIREVNRYIRMWQSTNRLAAAVKTAQDLGYTKTIASVFTAQDLPPHYFYLALQESDFNRFNVGPRTRWGIAKGMWQFIPETGQTYGLKIGPLRESPQPDPADDRFNWEKATGAAARYVKDIYATDAQASGLLVMASYNWGEQRVIDLLRKMPADPRQRNFWKLLELYRERMPLQTYNYVFNIVSAAVIGENPRLFGFKFDNPLAFVDKR
jgi:peptidoglycan lytic transglycosylase D